MTSNRQSSKRTQFWLKIDLQAILLWISESMWSQPTTTKKVVALAWAWNLCSPIRETKPSQPPQVNKFKNLILMFFVSLRTKVQSSTRKMWSSPTQSPRYSWVASTSSWQTRSSKNISTNLAKLLTLSSSRTSTLDSQEGSASFHLKKSLSLIN